jgi:hypothetical protein
MAFTEPQFCLPTTIATVPAAHVVITFADSAVGVTTVDVVLPTGDYWTARNYTSADELAKAFAVEATDAETAAGTLGTWSVLALPGGHVAEVRLVRTEGDPLDDVTSLTFATAEFPADRLGFSGAAGVVPYTSRDGIGDEHRWDSGWMGYLWMPGQIALVEEVKPRREVAVSVARYTGRSVVLALGEYSRWTIVLEGVWSALVWSHYQAQAAHVAAVTGLSTADTNAPLEALWRAHGSVDPLRYFPDYTVLGTYHDLEIVDPGWLRELDSAVTQSPGLARYQVRLPCKAWVS